MWFTAFWRFVKGRTKEQWLGVVAVATVLSYSLLYFAYFQFYSAFGLHPSDVGHDRLRLLQESLLGPLVLPIFLLLRGPSWIFEAVILTLVLLLLAIFAVCMSRDMKAADTLKEVGSTLLFGIFLWWAILTSYGYFSLVTMSRQLGEEVAGGGRLLSSWVYYGTRHIRSDSVVVPFLDVQALEARVTFTSKDASRPRLTNGCVIYLGSSDGTAVLYNFKTQEVVRVNTADVDLKTYINSGYPYYGLLPKRCRPTVQVPSTPPAPAVPRPALHHPESPAATPDLGEQGRR